MKFVNLTTHPINIIREDGGIESLQPSGVCARAYDEQQTRGNIDGIPVRQTVFGNALELPPASCDTTYVVSSFVARCVPDRRDVVSPNTHPKAAVRDDKGNLVAVRGFQCFWSSDPIA